MKAQPSQHAAPSCRPNVAHVARAAAHAPRLAVSMTTPYFAMNCSGVVPGAKLLSWSGWSTHPLFS
eukprot:11180326-Lingulodinium_polyedra.AAC.1